jgi:hypothetical protein
MELELVTQNNIAEFQALMNEPETIRFTRVPPSATATPLGIAIFIVWIPSIERDGLQYLYVVETGAALERPKKYTNRLLTTHGTF